MPTFVRHGEGSIGKGSVSLTPANDLTGIGAALGDFAARWRRPQRPVVWPHVPWEVLLLGVGVLAAVMAFDEPIARAAIALPRWIVRLAAGITDFGTSLYMFVTSAVVAVAAILARRRVGGPRVQAGLRALSERAAYVFVTVAFAGIAAQIVKHIVGRARPRFIDTLGWDHFQLIAFQPSWNSFPSGHSANAFAAGLALGILWPRSRPWLLAAATVVALSRIAVRAHYPSDTLAGALLGGGCAIVVGHLFAARGLAFRKTRRGLEARGARSVGAAISYVRSRWRRPAGHA